MRIAVTGATGFIGGALLQGLLADGHEVVAGTRGDTPANNTPGVSWVTVDFNSESNLAAFVSDVDAVVNCASPTASEFAGAASEFTEVYLKQISRLGAAAAKAEVALFIQLSTAQVQGLTAGQDENQTATQLSHYGLAHIKVEQTLEEILGESSTVLAIARLSNAFGWNPDLRAGSWNLFINQLILRAAQGKPIKLHGGPESKRDFIPVVDVVTAIMRLLVAEDMQSISGIWQVGSGVCRSLDEVIETVKAHVPNQQNLEVEWLTQASANELCVDIWRAEQSGLMNHSDFAAELRHLFSDCESAVSHD